MSASFPFCEHRRKNYRFSRCWPKYWYFSTLNFMYFSNWLSSFTILLNQCWISHPECFIESYISRGSEDLPMNKFCNPFRNFCFVSKTQNCFNPNWKAEISMLALWFLSLQESGQINPSCTLLKIHWYELRDTITQEACCVFAISLLCLLYPVSKSSWY